MVSVLHRLTFALSAFAFLCGIAVETPGALGAVSVPMVMGHDVMDCAGMDHPSAQAGEMGRMAQACAHDKAPAKNIKPDCMKSGCACPVNLPARTAAPMPTLRPAAAYWLLELPHTGRLPAPDPFPPITA